MTTSHRLLAPLAAVAAFAVACAGDPAEQRLEHVTRADAYMAEGKTPEAIIEYRAAIQIDPAYGEARFKLGEAYSKSGSPEAAFPEYVRAADLMPDDPKVQLIAGQYLLLATRYEDARARARKVLERDPKNAAAQVLLGNALAGLKDYDAAAASLERAIEFDPNRGLSYATLAAIETVRGRTPEAEAAYARAIEVDPKLPEARLALGSYRLQAGDQKGAEEAFLAALAIDPKNALALRSLASMYVNLRQADKAEPHLRTLADELDDPAAGFMLSEVLLVTGREADAVKRLEALSANRQHYAEAKLRLATLDFVAGRRDSAETHLVDLLKQQPRHAKALALRGRFRLEQGRLDEGIADLQQAVTTDVKYDAGHFWLAQGFLMKRNPAEARSALTAALRLNPSNVPAKVEMSRLHLNAREYGDAVRLAEEAVRDDPSHFEARIAVIRAYLGAGRVDDAARVLGETLPQRPRDERLQMLDGQLRLARRDPKAAEQRFAAALSAQPTSYEALGGLVASRLAAGNVAGAREAADAAVAKTPSDARSLVVAARVYGETRDLAAAESLLKRAIAADPSLLEAYSMLGQIYVAQRRLDDALREFDRLSTIQPNAIGPKTVVAVLHHMANRRPEAKAAYEAVLRIDSTAVVAANNLAWMKVEDNENLDVALQLAQAAKAKAPEAPEVSDTLGLIYYRRNLFAFSVAAYEDAVKYGPKNPEYHYRLGLALTKNNQPQRAREAFKTALSLNPKFPGADDAKAQLAALP